MAMTVQQLQALLAQTPAGGAFALADSALGIPAVQQLFATYLPDQTLTLTGATANVQALTVTGGFALGSYQNLSTTVSFTTDDAKQNVTGIQVRAALPGWAVQTSFLTFSAPYLQAFGFTTFCLLLAAVPDATGQIAPGYGVGADFPFTAADGPHTLTLNTILPTDPTADYLLEADLGGITLADLSALTQFAKGASFAGIIPGSVPIAKELELLALRVSVNPSTTTINSASIDVKLADSWTIIPKIFVFESIAASFTVVLPTVAPTVSASLYCVLQGPDNLEVGAGFSVPDLQMEAQLLAPLALSQLFDTYLPGVPFPTLTIDSLQFDLNVGTLNWDLQVTTSENWPIIGAISLQNLMLTAEGQSTGAPAGAVSATFDIAGTMLFLSAAYLGSGQGWQFLGETLGSDPLEIGQFLSDITAQFGVSVPSVLAGLTLANIRLQVTTGTAPAFEFTCSGSFGLAGSTATLSTDVSLVYNQSEPGWDKSFTGTLTLTAPSGRAMDFTVTYQSDPTDTTFTAKWDEQGGPLEFADICGALGFTPPTIPPDLDLALVSAGFTYDTTKAALVIACQSQNYGKAVFTVSSQGGTQVYAFLLDVDKQISLSNLPLIGGLLTAEQSLSISGLQVIASSAPITDAKTINTLINETGSGYPNVPAIGTKADICLAATLNFGGETIPLTMGIGDPQSTAATTATGQGGSVTPTPAAQTDGVTWFNIQKSFGPVTFDKVGVQYQNSILWFLLSASLSAGGLTISLQGLAIGSPLSSFEPQFNLMGLGIDYANSPVAIGGALVHLPPKAPITLEFDGTAVLSAPEFSLNAYGSYADLGGHPSMFLFAQVDGEFGGPPAFFVTGIAAGFGYNSSLRIPAQNEVINFPLVAGVSNPSILGGPNATPMQALTALTGGSSPWVSHTLGETWLAAGVSFTSFKLVNSQALLVVEFGQELTIALIGLSTARFPQTGSQIYAQVQLELEVLIQPNAGLFAATALLSPNSFVLDPSCLLTGGFAFYTWFGNNQHAGDFVLTLGGYNPAFAPPAWYPTEPRLGFTWSLDGSVSVTGSAYFALTPAAIMAGGALAVNFHDGNLKAWFTAYADIIVWWNPFHFIADIGISVGASYKVDLWFTSKTFSVELGADLTLWGPPTGGTVRVHWWIISFSVDFGSDQTDGYGAQPWSSVQATLPQTPVQITPTAGLAGQEKNGSDTLWVVRSDRFAFNTAAAVPASELYTGSASKTPIAVGDKLNILPMQQTGLAATHRVSLVGETEVDLSAWNPQPVKGNVAGALWGTGSGSQLVPADQQLVPNQIVGATLTAPPPQLGASPGTIALSTISDDPLPATGVTPLAAGSPAQGDVPQSGINTIAAIEDSTSGIMGTSTVTARTQIYTALTALGYDPGSNGSLTALAANAGAIYMGEPMMVPVQMTAPGQWRVTMTDKQADPSPETLGFYANYIPSLEAGVYTLTVDHDIQGIATDDYFQPVTQQFEVRAPQFSLDPGEIHSVYPAASSSGVYGEVLPNLVLNRRVLPWERYLTTADKRIPWLALVVCRDGDLIADGQGNTVTTATVEQFLQADPTLLKPAIDPSQVTQSVMGSQCGYITMAADTFTALVPRQQELSYLAHVRNVNVDNQAIDGFTDVGWFSVVIANRFPGSQGSGGAAGAKNTVHLVSLEGYADYLVDDPTWPTQQGSSQPKNVALASLYSWPFVSVPEQGESFAQLVENFVAQEGATPANLLLALPVPAANSAPAPVVQRLQDGYVPLTYNDEFGETTFAWYRGPFSPVVPQKLPKTVAHYTSSAQATIYLQSQGVFDQSYAAAWEMGRALALADRAFATALLQFRRQSYQIINRLLDRLASDHLDTSVDLQDLLKNNLVQQQLHNLIQQDIGSQLTAAFTALGAGTVPARKQLSAADPTDPVLVMQAFLAQPGVAALLADAVSEQLLPVAQWLAKLNLLYGVPFNNLVPDQRMLPVESLRFFYVDNNWLDSLTDGALSVGIESSRDTFFHKMMAGVIEDAINSEIAAVRAKLTGTSTGDVEADSPAEAMAGILIRSQLISGWPGLVVKAYQKGVPLKLLRMDRLSPNVLLCLFLDVPDTVTLAEPTQGLCFGVEDGSVIELRSLSGTVGAPLGKTFPASGGFTQFLRPAAGDSGQGVLNINHGSGALVPALTVALGVTALDPADFALEMVKAPELLTFAKQ